MDAPCWVAEAVKSPHLSYPVPVIVARRIPYLSYANRFQNLTIYLPADHEKRQLVGKTVAQLPAPAKAGPKYHVHIHGGAWRDPGLSSTSIEAAVAHAFADPDTSRLSAIISLNYTLSHFPTHPDEPYDSVVHNRSDPARDARHPDHVRDIHYAFALLRYMGLSDDSYVLSGHSVGACLAFQATLASTDYWASLFPHSWDYELQSPPRPAVLVGINGMYDLPAIVRGLGLSHAHLRAGYAEMLTHAFGPDTGGSWASASPAHFDADEMTAHIARRAAPLPVIMCQSLEDQLVPMNQLQRMALQLEQVGGVMVSMSEKCTGRHAAAWEEGYMVWDVVLEGLKVLKSTTPRTSLVAPRALSTPGIGFQRTG